MLRSSIRNKLIALLLLVVVIPSGISILLTYLHTVKSTREQTIQENMRLLYQGKNNIENYLEIVDRLTLSVYKHPDFMNVLTTGNRMNDYESIQTIKKILSSMYHFNDDIEQVFLYLDKRQQAYSVSKKYVFNAKHLDIREHPVFEPASATRGHSWLEPPHVMTHYGIGGQIVDNPSMVFSLHRLLANYPDKTPLGYLSIDFSTETVHQLSEHLYDEDKEQLFLVAPGGVVFFSSGEADESGESAGMGEWLRAVENASTDSGYLHWRDDEFNGVIFFEKLSESVGGLYLVKRIPNEVMFESAQKMIRMNIAIGCIMLVLVIAATTLVTFRITSPIRVLLRTIRRVEKGDMDVDFGVQSRDEIGLLSLRFQSMIHTIKHLLMREQRLELQNRTNQLKVLQSQINPHFLHNALQSIGSLAVDKGAPEVYKLLRSLSSIMRYSMETEENLVPLSKEIEHVLAYLHLQQERFGERLSVEVQIDDRARSCIVPKMILQPIVENYFKHGFQASKKAGSLQLEAALHESGELQLMVRDNGPGLTETDLNRLQKGLNENHLGHELKGMGLTNTNNRLKLYFGARARLRLEPTPGGGLTVWLILPAITDASELEGGMNDEGAADR